MKIKNQKDVEELNVKIKNDLGIDMATYRNEQVVKNFISLVVFPTYILYYMGGPVLLSLLLYVLGFWVFDLVHVQYLIYGVFGALLFLPVGILAGLLYMSNRMRSDIWNIIEYSLVLMKRVVEDTVHINKNVLLEDKANVLSMLFKGVIHIVTLPMLAVVIEEKLPILGGLVYRFVNKVCTMLSNKFSFDEVAISTSSHAEISNKKALSLYLSSITKASNGLSKLWTVSFKIVQFPVKASLYILGSFLVLFVYLIN